MSSRSPAPGASPLRQSVDLSRDDTVIRRRVPSHTDTESLLTYRTSIDGSDDETF